MINSSIFVLGFGTSISKMQTEKTKNRGNLVNLSLFHYYTTGLVYSVNYIFLITTVIFTGI